MIDTRLCGVYFPAMDRILRIALLVSAAASLAPPERLLSASEPVIDFDREIAPLLAARCLDCHGGNAPKGGLDLGRRAGMLAGGESGAVIAPGKPDESLLWQHVANDEMPPKKPLAADEKAALRTWIETGAAWGTDPIDPFRATTQARAGYDWWSLRPVKRPEPPAVKQEEFVRNSIDRFVLAKLESQGLSPSPPADRRTLIRRLSFDLLGLPPTGEEVDAFVRDEDPRAYERLVGRLLDSPHYGERWARHWLDVARYGETDGFERNGRRLNAWHYRDWVVRALNEDLPYDAFCRMQLAGDVFAPHNADAVRATGYLVAGVHNTVLGNDMMRAIARQDELEDIVGNVAQTFLGLTANCGRCHDHKFDPISQQDFYRLASALSGVQHGERELPDPDASAELQRLAEQMRQVRAEIAAIDDPRRRMIVAEQLSAAPPDVHPPEPVAAWNLQVGYEDQVGRMHLQPAGEVHLGPAGARLANGAFLRSGPLAQDLQEKTLEAWVQLDDLSQSGGGVLSLQSRNGEFFDAIVFGEREPQRWMAGSNGFQRTQSFGGDEEQEAAGQPVHFAIVYAADGMITGYRNGVPYGNPYPSSGPHRFAAQESVVLLGCRHEPAGGNRMLAGTIVRARLYDRALVAAEVAASARLGGVLVTEKQILERLAPQDRDRRTLRQAELGRLETARAALASRASQRAYAATPQPPGETRVLARGDVTQPGEVIAPGGIAAVSERGFDFGLPANAPESERRRRLAEWITAADNPLFARVIVNRLWHHHFGAGIVETPNDFGFNGGRPSHPELLDWLAAELVSRQYRLKEMHRLIVSSATYRQASLPRAEALAEDADSRLLWRKRPLRLEGEALRDSMLAVAGLLNPRVGGQGFSDYRIVDAMNGTTYYEPFDPTDPESQRRSIYRFTPRGGNQGLLDMFDCPDPAASAPRRNATTTPLHALTLWNSEFALRMADSLAARIRRETPTGTRDQVDRAYRLTLQRHPSAGESAAAVDLVDRHGLRALGRVLLNTNEFLTVE